MRAIIYARVSTDKQTHDSQLQEGRGYCDRRGWRVYREIIETASGAKTRRTGLDDLMALVRRGKGRYRHVLQVGSARPILGAPCAAHRGVPDSWRRVGLHLAGD